MFRAFLQMCRGWLVSGKPKPAKAIPYRFSRVVSVQNRSEATSENGTLVLIGAPNKFKWLRFLCPCGCGDELALNLMVSHYPCWTVAADDHGITVHPSVNVARCGAHFWLRANTVFWCEEPRRHVEVKAGLLQRFWRICFPNSTRMCRPGWRARPRPFPWPSAGGTMRSCNCCRWRRR